MNLPTRTLSIQVLLSSGFLTEISSNVIDLKIYLSQIGFNAGNGTQSYEYKPYSQASVLRDLTGRGWANGFPGRHIFRIDEKILMGTCNKDIGKFVVHIYWLAIYKRKTFYFSSSIGLEL